jgi:hypothetical protein
MSTQRARSQKPSPKAAKPRRAKWTGSLALMLIDERPIRSAAIRSYEKAEKEAAKLRDQIEAFETGDLPAYSRWEAQVFGAVLSEIRELASQLETKQTILAQIEEERFWTNCSRVVAYRRVMEARNNPTPPPTGPGAHSHDNFDDPDFDDPEDPDFAGDGTGMFGGRDLPPDFDLDDYDRMSKRQRREYHEAYEDMAELFEMMTGMHAPDLNELIERERAKRRGEQPDDSDDPFHPSQPTHPAAQKPDDRVKELYRTLVRRLHPDRIGEHSARERELWQQVQDAYHARDLQWLEAIAGRLDAVQGGLASLSIQVLHRMTQELMMAIEGLRSRMHVQRKNPAWNFRQKAKDLAKFEAKRRGNFTYQRNQLIADLQLVTLELDELARRAAKPPKNKKAKKATAARAVPVAEQDYFPF